MARLPRPHWGWTVRHARTLAAAQAAAVLFAQVIFSLLARPVLWAVAITGIAVGAVLLVIGITRDKLRRQYGTAYLVDETSKNWTAADEDPGFIDDVRRRFLNVVNVAGPRVLDGWDWDLDTGGGRWQERAHQLADLFQAARKYAEVPGTATSVFIRARWEIAMGLGANVRFSDRAVKLRVWQSPSRGRVESTQPDPLRQRPHSFSGGELRRARARLADPVEVVRSATLTATGNVAPSAQPPALLVLRTSRNPWGPLGQITGSATEKNDIGVVTLDSWTAVIPAGPVPVQVHELRCFPRGGSDEFDWDEFPAVVAACAEWIERKNSELGGQVLLLGATMPREIAFGVGMCAGDASRQDRWPEHLHPVVWHGKARRLILPCLDLGIAGLLEHR